MVSVVCLALAAVWTSLLFVVATTVSVYSGQSTTTASDGTESTTSTSATLVQENGYGVLLVLGIPAVAVLLTAVLLALAPRVGWAGLAAWAPVACMGLLTLLSMLSIGVTLLPVTVLLAVAVVTARLAGRPAAPSPGNAY